MTVAMYNCPLLNNEIPIGLCYDVQMIRRNAIKMSILESEFDRGVADKLCENCPFNQLRIG